ncbi:MAG: biotin/lipoyl-containing protein [Actinomycetota bacterium]
MHPLVLLATEAAASGGGTFIKGVAVFLGFMVFFVGSTWLLISMILGARLGYLVTGASLFSVFTILSAIWFVTALGPKGSDGFLGALGEETAWQPVATGPELGSVESSYGTLDVGDYPDGEGWVRPSNEGRLADLGEDDSTADELDNARPVMESLVGEAVNAIPGIRESVKDKIQGEVTLDPENFELTDFRMKETEVAGKDSIVAVGKAVPKADLISDLGGVPEGEVVQYLVEVGDQVTTDQPVAEVKAGDQTIQLNSDREGKVLDFGFEEGDNIKTGVPYLTVDISGQPGAPPAVEVVAARVRGSVRVPAFIYLVASLLLMAVHLVGLQRYERAAQVAQPQTA